MNFIKIILALAVLSVLPAFGQQSPTYGPQTLLSAWTVAATLNTNLPSKTIDCRKQQNVTLQISQVYSNAGASNVVYTFHRSVDGSTFESTAFATITVAGNGTTPVVTVTNLTVAGAGYLRLTSITNGHTAAILTNTISYGVKISSP